MSEEIIDRVHVILPTDKELLFPAAAMMQHVLDTYDVRMLANDVSRGTVTYKLDVSVAVEADAWELLARAGYALQTAVRLGPLVGAPTLLFDMSDARINAFKDLGKHAGQVCGLLCGEQCSPLPRVRQIKPSLVPKLWSWLMQGDRSQHLWFTCGAVLPNSVWTAGEELFEMQDSATCGVIGYRGWETYLAASMGLPVIELYPESDSPAWLSKWSNPLYRMVVGEDVEQLKTAVRSIEAALRIRYEKELANALV